MPVAAIGDQEAYQRPHSFDVGAVDNGSTIARATDQTGTGENAEVG
jgi:hypothetical protein